VYNDGDNTVYKHQTADTKEKVDYWRKHFNNTSGNGVNVGKTIYWYDALKTTKDKENNPILSDKVVTGKYKEIFKVTKEQMKKMLPLQKEKQARDMALSTATPITHLANEDFKASFPSGGPFYSNSYSMLVNLALLSANYSVYAIKFKPFKSENLYRIFIETNGKRDTYITTGRALGNLLFGQNCRAIADFFGKNIESFWKNIETVTDMYNNMQNGEKVEHPYSKSNQLL
jgi:hypothetical protein